MKIVTSNRWRFWLHLVAPGLRIRLRASRG